MVSEEYFLKSFIDEIVRLHKPKALRALAQYARRVAGLILVK